MSNVMFLTGRRLLRVPLDFDCPVGDTWEPLIHPPHNFPACEVCGPACAAVGREHGTGDPDGKPYGDGYSSVYRNLNATWYASSYMPYGDEWRPYADALGWSDKLTQREVDIHIEAGRLAPNATAEDVNEAQRTGHSEPIDAYAGIAVRCELLGAKVECHGCGGRGFVPPSEQAYKEWESWEPPEIPEGPGFQMWQFTSEGGPISPVFDSLDGLLDWLPDNASVFGYSKMDRAGWAELCGKEMSAVDLDGNLV